MSLHRKLRLKLLTLMLDSRVFKARRQLVETRRKLSGRRHVVSVFLQIDDPYSYILSHYLPSLAEHYDIELRLYLSEALGEDYQPEPGLLAEYAVLDCMRLAAELGVPFLDKGSLPPTEHRVGLSNSVAAAKGSDRFDDELRLALEAFWRGDTAAVANSSQAGESGGGALQAITASQKILRELGHYSSAMLHYGGEWYWGVDRLHYLTERLDELGLAVSSSPHPMLKSIKQTMRVSLPVEPPSAAKNLPAIEYFHSFRSPYSYIAFQRIAEIADAFGVELKVRPVLPMVMRGMKVPQPKLLYVVNDTCREAGRKSLPFGRISDPVGAGAERCLAVFRYAESEKRGRDFIRYAGRAIWSEAIDVASDRGMRKVSGRTGLFWPEVIKAMDNDDWRQAVEANRESMMTSGLWGVPTMRMGDFFVWGQDRDWMLVRHIEELCDTGDGIIV
jgi:2-hydroxychromene-2-carboxylate isomerase